MFFDSWLDRVYDEKKSKRISHCCGSRFKRERVLKDTNGLLRLEDCGKSDFYAYIQSHKDSVDINKILERYRSGDVSALDQVRAQYLDISEAPRTLSEMYSFIKNCQTFFDGLPLEVRQEYDFNPAAFVADIGSEKFMRLMKVDSSSGSVGSVGLAVSESEVIENA